MTRQEFHKGIKVYLSCGGLNPDKETLELWFNFLKDISLGAYQYAIKEMVNNIDDLALVNFVKQVKDRAGIHDRIFGDKWKEQLEKPADAIPQEKLLKLCKDFNKNLKGTENAE